MHSQAEDQIVSLSGVTQAICNTHTPQNRRVVLTEDHVALACTLWRNVCRSLLPQRPGTHTCIHSTSAVQRIKWHGCECWVVRGVSPGHKGWSGIGWCVTLVVWCGAPGARRAPVVCLCSSSSLQLSTDGRVFINIQHHHLQQQRGRGRKRGAEVFCGPIDRTQRGNTATAIMVGQSDLQAAHVRALKDGRGNRGAIGVSMYLV